MYTNTNLIEAQLQRDLTTSETTLLTTLIPAVDLWIDRTLGTSFIEQEAVSSRYYEVCGDVVEIDPCTNVTEVASVDNEDDVDVTYTTGTDYLLKPANSDVKTSIDFGTRNWTLNYSIMPHADNYRRRIKVTAKFSEYDEGVPEDVQIAATRICAGMIGESYSNQANDTNLKSESIEGYSVTYGESVNADATQLAMSDPIVKGILDSRRELLV